MMLNDARRHRYGGIALIADWWGLRKAVNHYGGPFFIEFCRSAPSSGALR